MISWVLGIYERNIALRSPEAAALGAHEAKPALPGSIAYTLVDQVMEFMDRYPAGTANRTAAR